MTRDEVQQRVVAIFFDRFEIENPELDVNLREAYHFDSIDALELLSSLEDDLERQLTQEEKRQAMEIRTLRDVIDYVLALAATSDR